MLTNSATRLQELADYNKEISHWMSLLPQQHSSHQGRLELTLPMDIKKKKGKTLKKYCYRKERSIGNISTW